MPKMRAIDAAVHVLEREGVTHAFGVPGAAIHVAEDLEVGLLVGHFGQDKRVDVAGRERNGPTLQELCAGESAHRVVLVVSFLRSSRRIRSASSPNCCEGFACSGAG